MDDTDRNLLALLRKVARSTIAVLATELKVSRGTVSNRQHKLETEQVGIGYGLRLVVGMAVTETNTLLTTYR